MRLQQLFLLSILATAPVLFGQSRSAGTSSSVVLGSSLSEIVGIGSCGFGLNSCASISAANIQDPWLVPISSICNVVTPPTCSGTANTGTVEVITSSPHGLSNGNVVNISGVYDSTQTTTQLKNTVWNTFGGSQSYGGGVNVTVDSATTFHYSSTINSSANITTTGQTGFVVTQLSPKLNVVFNDPTFNERTVKITCRDLLASVWPSNSDCGPAGANPFGFTNVGYTASFEANSTAAVNQFGILCVASCLHPGNYWLYVPGNQFYNGTSVASLGTAFFEIFNPTTMQVTPVPNSSLTGITGFIPAATAPWSNVNPDVYYFASSGVVTKVDLSANGGTGGHSTVFTIAANCTPPGWDTNFGTGAQSFVSTNDRYFEIAGGGVDPNGNESLTGQQYWNFNLIYDTTTGTCYWENTITSQWGTINPTTGPFSITDNRTGKPLAQTTAPVSFTPTTSAGGLLPVGTYFLKTTYCQVFNQIPPRTGRSQASYGESLPSPEATVTTTSGNQVINVVSPPNTPVADSSCGSIGCAYDQVTADYYKVYLGSSSGSEVDVTPLVFGPKVTLTAGSAGTLATGSYGVKLSYLLNENGSTQEESDGTTPALCINVTGPTGSISVPEPTQVATEINWKVYTATNSGTCASPTYGTFFISSVNVVGAGTQVIVSIPVSGANPLPREQNQTGPIALGIAWSTPVTWSSIPTGSYTTPAFYVAQNSSGTTITNGSPPTIGTSGFTVHSCAPGGLLDLYPGCGAAGSGSPDGFTNSGNFSTTWYFNTNNGIMCNSLHGPDGTVATACGGHPVSGYNFRAQNVSASAEPYNFYRQSLSNFSVTLQSNPPSPLTGPEDMHQGWLKTDSTDTQPFIFDGELTAGDDRANCSGPFTYNSGWALKVCRAWDNEVVGGSMDGSRRFFRYAKDHSGSFGSGLNWLYPNSWGGIVADLPICNMSPDGKYAVCAVDWYGTQPSVNLQPPSSTIGPGMQAFIFELK